MARVYAVDLGAWSVKVVVATQGLRGATINHVIERLVPPGDGPLEPRAIAVLAAIVREFNLSHDAAFWGLYGDQVFTNILDFDFRSLRRADLHRAVGAELESLVPLDLEDMVYASDTVPEIVAAPELEGHSRGRVAAPTLGMRVLSYAMAKSRAESLIAQGQAIGAEPRGLLPVAGAAARLIAAVPSFHEFATAGTVAVIDIGHERCDVVVLSQGKAAYSRTMARAGKQVTAAIAQHWKLSFADAERAKHSDGFVASSLEPATSEAWDRVHQVVVAELLPFARDLRQTLASARARTGATISRALVVGGGARLRGLASFLTEQLGVPCSGLSAADIEALAKIEDRSAVDSSALTIGMAIDAASGRPTMDLRSGVLASRMDLSYLRTKALPLGIALGAVLTCAIGASYADWYRLKKAEKTLALRVAQESAEYFPDGKSRDVATILGTATNAGNGEDAAESPLPRLTGYDILLEVANKIPPKDKITLDVTKLEITRDKIDLGGTAKKPEEIDALVTALREIKCFGEIGRGATESDANGLKKFTLSIPSTCM
ncbi:MAG: pilus assembly protein PilM [Kofleriaceae bacterium]|nr:pilus assembly protein PilM [Kofleriaceae bacterium]